MKWSDHKKWLVAVALIGGCAWGTSAQANVLVRFDTVLGAIDVELFDDDAPLTVANFLNYVNDGDYTDSIIHRSAPGFVIQGGGFQATLPPAPIAKDAPVENEPGLSNVRGTIAMAKLPGDPDSATSEWFFNLGDNSGNLDNQNGGFTVFGRVADDASLAVMDAIAGLQVFAAPGFDELPLIDFPGGLIGLEHLVVVNDITVIGEIVPEPGVGVMAGMLGMGLLGIGRSRRLG